MSEAEQGVPMVIAIAAAVNILNIRSLLKSKLSC